MLGLTRKRPDNAAAVDRLRHWTRTRFTLADSETIMAAEIACAVPGCPPVESHVVFWTGLGRHHFKIFKPVAEVTEDDLPPAFMKTALIALDGADCDCC
jgi:nitrate reductase delta subunit